MHEIYEALYETHIATAKADVSGAFQYMNYYMGNK